MNNERMIRLRYTPRIGSRAVYCSHMTDATDDGIIDEICDKMKAGTLPGMWALPGVDVAVDVVNVESLSGVVVIPKSWERPTDQIICRRIVRV